MTTEEFMPCIDRMNMDKSLAQRLRGLCRAMDPVKFGGETVMEKQMETDLFFAREFVRKTTQQADEEENGRRTYDAFPRMMEIPKNKSQMSNKFQYPKSRQPKTHHALFGI
jgi:hypothetical protein